MVNRKKVTLYGPFGLVGIIMLVIGVTQFAKGTGGMLGGIGSIAVIAVLFMAFMAVKQNPKVDSWLKSGAEGKKSPSATDTEKRFKEMQQRAKEVKSDEDEAAKHENPIMSRVRRVVAYLGPLTSRLSRKPTIGEQLTELARTRPEVDKSLEMLAVEVATSQRFILKTIAGLENEHSAVAEKIKETKRRRAELSKLERKVASDIAKYEKVAAGSDLEAKIRDLKDIETRLDKTKADSNVDFKQVVAELGKAESYCNYLQSLGKRIADTVKELQDSIRPDWRDKTYQEMMTRLDRMDRALKENLIRAASEHKEILVKVSQKVKSLEDNVRKVKQSELFEIMLSHRTKAAEAAAEADIAKRNITDLTGRLAAAQQRGELLDAQVKALEGQVKSFETISATWQSDLDSARELVKKNPQLGTKLADVLDKNIREQSSLLFTLISIVRAKEDFAASCKDQADTAAQQLLEAHSQVVRIEEKNSSLAESLEAATAAKKDIEENITTLREEMKKTKAELEASIEEKVKQEHHDELMRLAAEMEKAKKDLVDVNTEKEKIQSELKGKGDNLAAAKKELEDLKPQLPLLEEKKRAAQEEAERVKKQLVELETKKNEAVTTLERQIEEFRKQAAAAAEGIKQANKETVNARTEVDNLKRDIEGFAGEKEKILRRARSAEEREAAEKEAKERFEKLSRELVDNNDMLVKDVENWQNKSLERLKALSDLTKSSNTLRKELEDSVAAKTKSNENARKRIEELTREKEALQEQVKNAESGTGEETAEVDRDLVANLHERADNAGRLLKGERDALRKSDNDLAKAKKKLEEARGELGSLKDQVAAAELQLRQAKSEEKRISQQVEQDMLEHQANVDELEGKVEEKRREAARLDGDLLKSQKDLKEATYNLELLREEKAEEEKLKLAKIKEDEELVRNLELARAAAKAAEDLGRILEQLRDEQDQLQVEFDKYKSAKDAELDGAKIRNGAMWNYNIELNEENGSLRKQLAAANSRFELLRKRATGVPGLEAEVQRAHQESELLVKELEDKKPEQGTEEQKLIKEPVEQLKQELLESSRRATEEKEKAKLVDQDIVNQTRIIWFDSMLGPIRECLDKGRTSRDEDMIILIDNRLAYATDFRSNIKLTEEEIESLQILITQLEEMKKDILDGIKRSKEATQPKIVLKPGLVGVLEPITSERYAVKVSQFKSPKYDDAKVVPNVVLDYMKETVMFGRLSRKKSEDTPDVVITGNEADIRQISRKHFSIIRKGDTFELQYLGRNKIIFEDGTTLPSGNTMLLTDKIEFFIDPDKDFGFRFRVLKSEEVEKDHWLDPLRTTVEYREREQKEIEELRKAAQVAGTAPKAAPQKVKGSFGCLNTPFHCTGGKTIGGKTLSLTGRDRIILNKSVLNLGRALEGNHIQLLIDDGYLYKENGNTTSYAGDKISDKHALIRKEKDAYFIEGLTEEKTFVNYKKLTGRRKLKDGDIIHFGLIEYLKGVEPCFLIFKIRKFEVEQQEDWEKYVLIFGMKNVENPKQLKKNLKKDSFFGRLFG